MDPDYTVEEYVSKSNSKPMGDVRTYFYRYEFQSAGSLGSLLHAHGGLTLHDGIDKAEAQRRISRILEHVDADGCSVENMSGSSKMFPDRNTYWKVRESVAKTMMHNCFNANNR